MPFVNVKISGPPLSVQQARSIQERSTELMERIMRKNGQLTVVGIDQAQQGAWSIGGQPAPSAAFVEVKVTEGTNTAGERARFIEEAEHMLREVLGRDLDPVTYVVIHEVAGDAWGYGGVTQARRAELAKAA